MRGLGRRGLLCLLSMLLVASGAASEVLYFPDPGHPLVGSSVQIFYRGNLQDSIDFEKFTFVDAPEGLVALDVGSVDKETFHRARLYRNRPAFGYASASLYALQPDAETLYPVRIQTKGIAPGLLDALYISDASSQEPIASIDYGDRSNNGSFTDEISHVLLCPRKFTIRLYAQREHDIVVPEGQTPDFCDVEVDLSKIADGETVEIAADAKPWSGDSLVLLLTKGGTLSDVMAATDAAPDEPAEPTDEPAESTDEPEASAVPEETEQPEEIEQPEESAKPSEEPEATATPVATSMTKATATPNVTDQPKVIQAVVFPTMPVEVVPSESEKPEATDEPEATEAPVVTEGPTPEPTAVPTPVPTEEPIPEPTEAPTPEQTPAPTPAPIGFITVTSKSNVRTGGNTDFDTLGSVQPGEEFDVETVAESGWYGFMWSDGTMGYISPKRVELTPGVRVIDKPIRPVHTVVELDFDGDTFAVDGMGFHFRMPKGWVLDEEAAMTQTEGEYEGTMLVSAQRDYMSFDDVQVPERFTVTLYNTQGRMALDDVYRAMVEMGEQEGLQKIAYNGTSYTRVYAPDGIELIDTIKAPIEGREVLTFESKDTNSFGGIVTTQSGVVVFEFMQGSENTRDIRMLGKQMLASIEVQLPAEPEIVEDDETAETGEEVDADAERKAETAEPTAEADEAAEE